MSKTVYDYHLKTIKGEDLDLSTFRGKKILFINTASFCGYTKQYTQMQELYENFKDKLVVLGLPCNDFGEQEPESEAKVAEFCEVNYHVTFPMTSKIHILGHRQHPLYNFLTQKELNGVEDVEVKWNFWKFLVDENGHYIKNFSTILEPVSEEIINEIEKTHAV